MSDEKKQPEYMSLYGVCQLTGLRPSSFYKASSTKTGVAASLPVIKLGRKLLYKRSDVIAWIEKHTRPAV
jgi:predicted DNA-binding transcriptional regulator AlpA